MRARVLRHGRTICVLDAHVGRIGRTAELVFRLQPEADGVVVGAELIPEQGWAWPGETTPIEPRYWEGGLNPMDGQCVVLRSSGLLDVSQECDGHTLCKTEGRPSCGTP